jgi:L-ascorbate metabolism protein UlaG (beta-lactamase superfamily)
MNNHDGKNFVNLEGDKAKKAFTSFLKWQFSKKTSPWPFWIENTIYPMPRAVVEDNEILVTFINHSSVLIQTQGLNILTDPVYSERVSPLKWVGPKRIKAPGIEFNFLPKIDIILLSHDHYDHLDANTLINLQKKFNPKIFAGLKVNNILQSINKNLTCHEMNWWEDHQLNEKIKIHFLPAKHWSGRKAFYGRNYSLWGSFALETTGGNIYFAGDTGYGNHFKLIKEQFNEFKLALLPIGAYEPRWFMKDSHVNPEEAVMAHIDLNATNSLAIHHGTFKLADEAYEHPREDLIKALNKFQINQECFRILSEGQSWSL